MQVRERYFRLVKFHANICYPYSCCLDRVLLLTDCDCADYEEGPTCILHVKRKDILVPSLIAIHCLPLNVDWILTVVWRCGERPRQPTAKSAPERGHFMHELPSFDFLSVRSVVP